MLTITGCTSISIEEHRLVIMVQDGDPNHPTVIEVKIPDDWKQTSMGFVGGLDGEGIPVLISHNALNGTTFEIHNYGVSNDRDERVQW